MHSNDAKKAGINAVIWDLTTPDLISLPELIFISPESITTETFIQYLNKMVHNHLLERIIFDECHEIVTSGRTYRPKMMSMIPVVKGTGVQIVFLSATLPPMYTTD
jgi:superfamily II DNA helicase RecQ